jgi:hypothetical protein
MKNDIRKYRIHSKLLFGNNLKIFLQSKGKEYKVLELKDIIGFMDNFSKKGKLSVLRIDKPCGSYPIFKSKFLSPNDDRFVSTRGASIGW